MNNASTIKKIEKMEKKRRSDKIVKFLSSSDEEVVEAALNALSRIGDEIAINSVTPMIDNENIEIRKSAIKAIGTIGTEYSKTYLQHRMTKESDEEVKALILDTIHSIKGR